MGAASSPSAAAVWKNEVLIICRSEDTCNGFASHLYDTLSKKHIKVGLEKGDDIARALPNSVEESSILIIILSEDYAFSHQHLDALVHILKCREEKNQIVLPIFYGVDPSHIEKQEGTYAAAFFKHQDRFKDKVDKWRQALTEVAGLSGWDSRNQSESGLVERVVEFVIRKLESIWSISIDEHKGLVGIRRPFCKIESLLCFDSPNVLILGIWGKRGIGKTTLARVVYQHFSKLFGGRCFLPSVREEAQRKGLVELEKEMFSKLLQEKYLDVYNSFVNVRLSRTKALLVLDDANFEHFKYLAGNRDRFGPGSIIIVTSRDLRELNQLIDVGYEVPALDLKEASELFCLEAFKEKSCRAGYEEKLAEAVSLAGGNPLELQRLGSKVKCLDIEKRETELEREKKGTLRLRSRI